VNRSRVCLDCPAPVKLRARVRCHVCHRKAERAALKRPCLTCGALRHLQPGDQCATCTRAATPRQAAKTISCRVCARQLPDAGHGLCGRCVQADPDRPFRYAASMAARMAPAPQWWPALASFTAARRHPGGAIAVLRELARVLIAEPGLTPRHLLSRISIGGSAATARALEMFFTSHGMTLPRDETTQREDARNEHYLRPIDTALADAVVRFHQAQLQEQQRLRRVGRQVLSDITLTARLRVLRDLAVHLAARRQITGWAEVTTADLEAFLAHANNHRHQQTYVLRRFFTWARRHKLILINPTRRLTLGPQPAFTGTVLELATQRTLFHRWNSTTTFAHERLTGLLALLHAASNAQIRDLTVDDIDDTARTVALTGRPFPTPLDPATWDALQACRLHRKAMHTLNPHILVTRVTSGRHTAADSSYLTRTLAPAGTTPAICRQTRLTQLVTDLDPKLAAAALGMNNGGLVRYLADNVAQDRLHRSAHHG
jgi:hypothetical protein